MIIGLLIALVIIFIMPFVFHFIEQNLEYFLLVMGIAVTIIAGTLSFDLIIHIFTNYLIYFITIAVLIAGLIFRISVKKMNSLVHSAITKIPLSVFVFLLIIVLGIVSGIITAIIAALVLVEMVNALPLSRKQKVNITIISCFSIGLGASLTPIGEPLSTIVISALKADFFYLLRNIGVYVIPCLLILGLVGALYIRYSFKAGTGNQEIDQAAAEIESEGLKDVFVRAFKIFLFVIALDLLGSGFKPLINEYVIHFDNRLLYWINISSAVLDNATLAAAEISPAMSLKQIQAILMGLLLSGGMLIPGNIPNIISAGKLKIKSSEWAKPGVPLGLVLLAVYFVVLFIL